MKRMKRMLCMVAVIALLLTMTNVVSAATPTGASIALEELGRYTKDDVISSVLYRHVKGTADTHTYSIESINTGYTLNTSQISETYREDVVAKLKEEGYKSSVSVPRSGNVTIPATAASGAYVMHLIYTYATVQWTAKIGSAKLAEESVSGVPISLTVTPVLQ